MQNTIRLCRTADVNEGEPVAVDVEALPPLAVYNVGGEYFVTDRICTHGSAELTDGYQEDGIIECPFHGGAFDIATGEPTAFPCHVALKTYSVAIDDGWVCIEKPADVE